MTDHTFRRGDICWFNDPIETTEGTYIMHDKRPAVIVSNDGGNLNGDTVIIAPMTTKVAKRIYPGQFDVTFDGCVSRVRCDQIRVVDKSTLTPPVAHLSYTSFKYLDEALMVAVGIDNRNGMVVVDAI